MWAPWQQSSAAPCSKILQDAPRCSKSLTCNILQHPATLCGPQTCNIISLARRSIEPTESNRINRRERIYQMSLSFLSKAPKWLWGNTQVASERKARGFRHAAPQSHQRGYIEITDKQEKQLGRLDQGDCIKFKPKVQVDGNKAYFGHWAQEDSGDHKVNARNKCSTCLAV